MNVVDNIKYMELVICVLIIILAYYDLRYREIPIMVIGIGFILGSFICVLNIFCGVTNYKNVFLCCIPALFFICMHFSFPKGIGIGDGLVLLFTELAISNDKCYTAFIVAMIFLWIYALFSANKERIKREIPFIPFWAIGILVSEVII